MLQMGDQMSNGSSLFVKNEQFSDFQFASLSEQRIIADSPFMLS